ncbi:unnamed protein product [Sphenostylis stenocarpa]|uniref:Wax synthase domain-containing protein n=1 Tax=Sphenostylis stenocarpa TaxID=92480 RepID=A0AA86SBN1_9FABA|nr:unnamed protein product [Sphenostylis stenocarpa]
MESEIMNLIKVCLSVVISLCYCYRIGKSVPPGTTRLLLFLPIICYYILVPLSFSSVHLSGTLGFFLAWLANFKLLLLAFDKGPLSSDPLISLSRFVALACLPIKIQQNQPCPTYIVSSHSSTKTGKTPPSDLLHGSKSSSFEADSCKQNLFSKGPNQGDGTTLLGYAIKGVALGVLVKIYDYSESIHPTIIMCMYCFHMYFMLEIILAVVAAVAKSMLGMELEPQFKDPLRSTSLQDFWGRRWNLMVTSILRPTVYQPTLKMATKVVGSKWAPLPAVFSTFAVSGLMHELILFYLGRMEPTFRMTAFFLLHGICLTVEIAMKKNLTGRYRLPRFLSGSLTLAFVMVTSLSLFLPEFILRGIEAKAIEEYAALGDLLQSLTSSFSGIFITNLRI